MIAALLNALHDTDASVRFGAAVSLWELGQASPEVIMELYEALQNQETEKHVAKQPAC